MQVQTLPTVGATDVVTFQSMSQDWFVVVANGVDNTGNPNVDSVVYRWNGTGLQQVQQLATIGASALEAYSIGNRLYLAIASLTDTRYPFSCCVQENCIDACRLFTTGHKCLSGMPVVSDWITLLTHSK